LEIFERRPSGRRAVTAAALCAAALSLAAPVVAAEPENLCGPGETVWFGAALKGTGQLVSLCGLPPAAGAPGWVEFRKGKPGAIDLRYPAERAGSFKKFLYRRYTRPRTTYLKIEFARDGLAYAILEFFEADRVPPSSVSFRVSRQSDRTEISSSVLRMRTPDLQMMRLEEYLPTAPFNE